MAKRGTIYINKSLGVGFIPIPKNGSTTIRKHVFNHNLKGALKSMDDIPSEELPKIRKIAIISNPLTRFARAIVEIRSRGENTKTIESKEFRECKSNECKVISVLKDIKEFGFYDEHLLPQSDFLIDPLGNTYEVDEIWFLKDLTKKIKSIIPNYNGELTWTRGNNKKPFLDAIMGSKEIQDQIRELYPEDFKIFENPGIITNNK